MGSEPPPSTTPDVKKTQFYLTQLVILTILIIGLILIVSAYPRLRPRLDALRQVTVPTAHPSVTPSPTPSPSITPSPTSTLRTTLTPTITLTPSPTGTLPPTFTPPGPPTLTPAKPAADNSLFNLHNWASKDADLAALYMEDYPNTISDAARGENSEAYWAAYRYAVVALREAILRFPDDPLAASWGWRLAKNLARSGDQAASDIYANLIAGALNSNDTSLEDLPAWFHAHEPDFQLFVIETEPLPGTLSSYLLQIEGSGTTFIWLIEGSGAYNAYPLVDKLDFLNPTPHRVIMGDLTGDGLDEIIVFAFNEGTFLTQEEGELLEHASGSDLAMPVVFDLSDPPGKEIPFAPGEEQLFLRIEHINRWGIEETSVGQTRLVFDGLTFPACPVTVHMEYSWDGESLQRVETAFLLDPESSEITLCHIIVDHASENWGPEAAIELMETLLPYFQPAPPSPGKTLTEEDAANAKDEWLYRLGIYHALVGNVEASHRHLKEISERDEADLPLLANRQWYEPAVDFLNLYQEESDVYKACLDAPLCNPTEALAYLGRNMPESSQVDPIQWLYEQGVSLISSGYADFDQDGTSERWFTTRHRPLENPELWMIAETQGTPKAILIDSVDTAKPEWEILEGENGETVIRFEPGRYFLLNRVGDKRDPKILWLDPPYLLPLNPTMPDRFNQGLEKAEIDLLSGTDPFTVKKELLALADYPGLLCQGTWTCDRYYYLLGVASELSGDINLAIEAYLKLWRDYARSPFTTLARLKLLGTAISLATPTSPPATSTLGTPSPGGTPTVSPNPTEPYPPPPGLTPMPTSPYPYP